MWLWSHNPAVDRTHNQLNVYLLGQCLACGWAFKHPSGDLESSSESGEIYAKEKKYLEIRQKQAKKNCFKTFFKVFPHAYEMQIVYV